MTSGQFKGDTRYNCPKMDFDADRNSNLIDRIAMNGSRIFNFSRTNLATWCASVAMVCLAIGTAGPALGQSSDAEVAQIVKELKSDRFEIRQQATRELFALGPEILPLLEKIERSTSLEQNRRLENLKVVFQAIKAGQTSPVARRARLDFKDVGFDTRDLILEKLLSLKEYEAHFALLEQLEPQHIREVFEDNGYYYSQIAELCRSEQWEEIDRLLSMPIMWKYQPILCARFHFLMGKLENQITQLRKRLDDRANDVKYVFLADELKTVINLLSFQRQYDAAGRYVAKLPIGRQRLEAENQLLFERGDWKALAQRAVLAESDFDKEQPHIACTSWEYVLLKQYGQGVEAGIKAIDEIEALQRDKGTLDSGMLAALSMLTCDWEKAKTGVDLEQDELSVSLLFPILNRPEEMEELIGAGETFESRSKWTEQRREEIGKLIKKMQKESERRGTTRKFKELEAEARVKIRYYLFVCERWLDFGLEEEAVLYLREVFLQMHDVEQLANVKNEIMQRICSPNRPDVTWSFLREAGYSDSQLRSMAGTGVIFGAPNLRTPPSKVVLAQFLNGGLYESVKDPMERLQRISFLLGSALKPTDPETVNKLYPEGFDLDAELSRVSHNSSRTTCWQISQIYQHHRRHREALQWKELAALKGQADAVFSLAEDALAEGEYLKAARMFDAHFSESSRAYSLGLSSRAWKLAGEEQIARQRMFFASVIPQHYGSSMTEFYAHFTDDERGHWVSDLARLDTFIGEPSRFEEMQNLENAMKCWKLADPIECANFGRRRMLQWSAGNSVRDYRIIALFNIQSRTQDVMGAVEARDFDAVKSIFDQVNQFSPGSPSLVEKVVPRLDELGQVELADYITQETSAFFEDALVRYPNSALNRNNYAWLLACAGRRLDTVLRHAEMAVQLQPQEDTYIDTLAEAHFVRGEFDEAIEAIQHSIALDPPRRYYRNQLKKYQDAKAGN